MQNQKTYAAVVLVEPAVKQGAHCHINARLVRYHADSVEALIQHLEKPESDGGAGFHLVVKVGELEKFEVALHTFKSALLQTFGRATLTTLNSATDPNGFLAWVNANVPVMGRATSSAAPQAAPVLSPAVQAFISHRGHN